MGNYWSTTTALTIERRRYGWRRDLPDHRDHYHNFTRDTEYRKENAVVDLREKCPPIYNQGNLGSCTANAISGTFQFDELRQGFDNVFQPSRLFIYYNERDMEGTVNIDAGAEIRDGIKSISKKGVCPESSWPYDIGKFTFKPSESCYSDAENHRAVKYKRVLQNEDQMKACLDNGLPFVFGFTVYESFESDDVTKTGIVPMPDPNEKAVGGHAVMCVGYKEKERQFIIRNSWGADWGMNGYCLFPFGYLLNSDLSGDFWTVQRVSNDELVNGIKPTPSPIAPFY